MEDVFETYWQLIDDIDLLEDIINPDLQPTTHLEYHRKKCYEVLIKRLKARKNEHIRTS